MSVYDKLEELGLELPGPPKPVATYVPWVQTGSLIFVSGQIPIVAGSMLCHGVVPEVVRPDKAKAAARLCGLNILAVLHEATNHNLDAIAKVVRLGVYVASSPEFREHPAIADGASELMIEVFGPEIGTHSRAALGASSLPLGAPVEIDGVYEIA